jgi:hypothetical protein
VKIVLAVLVAVLVAGSFYADYKWRRWLEARRRGHRLDR